MTIISRTSPIDQVDHSGRILEGIAYTFDDPRKVVDPGAPPYLEEYSPASADRSIANRGKYPVGIYHPWSPGARTSPVPLGTVQFHRSDELAALVFRAIISRTVAGDEALELVRDEAMGDVSISAHPIRNTRRVLPRGGVVVRREEIKLRELSLVPTGLAQDPNAKVLVMRGTHLDAVDDQTGGTPRREAVRRRLLLL